MATEQAKLANLKQEKKELESALKEAQSQLRDRASQVNDLDDGNRQKSAEIESLMSEIEKLRAAQQYDGNGGAGLLSLQIEAVESEIRHLAQSKELNHNIQALQAENELLKKQTEELRASRGNDGSGNLPMLTHEIPALKSKIRKDIESKKFKDSIMQLHEENATMSTALEKTEQEKKALEDEICVRIKHSAEQAVKIMQLDDRSAELEASAKQLTDRELTLDCEVAKLKHIISDKDCAIADSLASLGEQQAVIKSRMRY